MPTTTTRTRGKTSFVKETLFDNPQANARFINQAWTKAGMDGTISDTLVNKMRSELGLAGNLRGKSRSGSETTSGEKRPYTGKKRGRKPKNASVQAVVVVADASQVRPLRKKGQLIELETELDRLIFKIMGLGGLTEIEDSLRGTRRMLYSMFAAR